MNRHKNFCLAKCFIITLVTSTLIILSYNSVNITFPDNTPLFRHSRSLGPVQIITINSESGSFADVLAKILELCRGKYTILETNGSSVNQTTTIGIASQLSVCSDYPQIFQQKDEQLKLIHFAHTFKYTINQPNLCNSPTDLLVIVTSAAGHFFERAFIRDTWGDVKRYKNVKLIFFIGNPYDENIQELIDAEVLNYNDLVQSDFKDSYENLTLKSTSFMKWSSCYCSDARFILKADDDMFVNLEKILEMLNTMNVYKMIMGRLARNWKPHRNVHSKWYVSRDVFPRPVFPDFVTGPSYLFTGDIVKDLFMTSLKEPFIFLEDVFLTGIVAEKLEVRRINERRFVNRNLTGDWCFYKFVYTVHGYSKERLQTVWEAVSDPHLDCNYRSDAVPQYKAKIGEDLYEIQTR